MWIYHDQIVHVADCINPRGSVLSMKILRALKILQSKNLSRTRFEERNFVLIDSQLISNDLELVNGWNHDRAVWRVFFFHRSQKSSANQFIIIITKWFDVMRFCPSRIVINTLVVTSHLLILDTKHKKTTWKRHEKDIIVWFRPKPGNRRSVGVS